MLSIRSRRDCAKCVVQAEEGILATGSVPLKEALEKRGVDVGDTAAVVAYVRVNLSRRAVKVSIYRRDTNQLRANSCIGPRFHC